MWINSTKIALFMMCVMLFNLSILSLRENNLWHVGIAGILLLWNVGAKQFKSILNGLHMPLFFCGWMLLSTFLNHGFESRTVTAALTGTVYFLLFWSTARVGEKKAAPEVLDAVWKFILLMTVMMDGIIILTRAEGITRSSNLASYLFGNKFTVSYVHMLLLALFQTHGGSNLAKANRRMVFWLLAAESVFICSWTDCMTGLIGCVIVCVICLAAKKHAVLLGYLARWPVFCTIMVLLSLFVLNSEAFLQSEVVRNLLWEVFHRSATLTGRLEIYQVALEAIVQKPLWGYGINSTYVEDVLTWGNAQNGLLKALLDHGIVGLLLFFSVCRNAFFTKPRRMAVTEQEVGLLAFLYGMAVCATVEVCLSGLFFLGLALLRMVRREQAKEIRS